jgi:hypothetical protein
LPSSSKKEETTMKADTLTLSILALIMQITFDLIYIIFLTPMAIRSLSATLVVIYIVGFVVTNILFITLEWYLDRIVKELL